MRENVNARAYPGFFVLLMSFWLLGACEPSSPCKVWTEKLNESGDMEQALREISRHQCVEAIPVLHGFFKEGLLQEAVLRTLEKIARPELAYPTLKLALRDKNTMGLAADLVREWGLQEAKEDLVAILENEAWYAERGHVFRALSSLGDVSAYKGMLKKLALADPDRQPIEVNRKAIEFLGDIGGADVTPVLLKAVFVRSSKGQHLYPEVRLALAKVGTAYPWGEIADFILRHEGPIYEFAKKNHYADWELDSHPGIMQVIADTLNPRAADLLYQDLGRDIEVPQIVPEEHRKWMMEKTNRFNVERFGLAYQGAATFLGGLITLGADASKDALRQRLNALRVVSLMGTDEAQKALLDAWGRGSFGDLIVGLQDEPLEIFAQAIDDRFLQKFDDVFQGKVVTDRGLRRTVTVTKAAAEAFERNERATWFLKVLRECNDQLKCYLEKSESKNQIERMKAVQVLGRGRFGSSQEIKDALLQTFDSAESGHVDVKRYALVAYVRLGGIEDGDALVERGEKLLEKGERFWGEELFALGHAMKRAGLD